MRHAFILDVLALLLCFALLFLGNKNIIPYWMLVIGAIIALVALVASITLFVKARKIDRKESLRIENEILSNAAKVDAVDEAAKLEDQEKNKAEIAVEQATEDMDYKADDEQ